MAYTTTTQKLLSKLVSIIDTPEYIAIFSTISSYLHTAPEVKMQALQKMAITFQGVYEKSSPSKRKDLQNIWCPTPLFVILLIREMNDKNEFRDADPSLQKIVNYLIEYQDFFPEFTHDFILDYWYQSYHTYTGETWETRMHPPLSLSKVTPLLEHQTWPIKYSNYIIGLLSTVVVVGYFAFRKK